MVSSIILAGGSGSRMHSEKAKQYLTIGGVPLIVHALRAFEVSPVDEIILVARPGDEDYVQREIVEKYEIKKVRAIVPGGKERFDSVWQGLSAISAFHSGDSVSDEAFDEAPNEAPNEASNEVFDGKENPLISSWKRAPESFKEGSSSDHDSHDIVLIHDGARPFVTSEMISASIEAAKQYGACTVAVPVKDTIKVVDAEGFGIDTPDRSTLYQVQTPQTFRLPLIITAHKLFREEPKPGITDDTMLVEEYLHQKCYIVPGDYKNIKITTPEDIPLAETILGM